MSNYYFKFGKFTTNIGFYSLDNLIPQNPSLIVTDSNTFYLIPKNMRDITLVLPPGEEYKNWDSINKILEKALELELARDSIFVGVGGGVICDMTAFASSVFMRGCNVTLVPTTLLSMVDAAIGGKSGIDYKGYKNLVGTFYPAMELRICVDTLKTLPSREFLSGLAEVIKTAMLGDTKLLSYLEMNPKNILSLDSKSLEIIINSCIKVKGSIVEKDLYEKSIRANLNLGHTFGHALETVTGFKEFSHGEGVAWGIAKAMETSKILGIVDDSYYERILHLLKLYNYRLKANIDITKLLNTMKLDKKKKGGVIKFILQTGLQETIIREIPEEILLKIL